MKTFLFIQVVLFSSNTKYLKSTLFAWHGLLLNLLLLIDFVSQQFQKWKLFTSKLETENIWQQTH